MPDTVGELLRKQRENRNLSVEDVTKATHIRLKYIEAMENNRFDLLPSAVQGRGFLRMVADFLDLPADPLVKAMETGVLEVEEPVDPVSAQEEAFMLESDAGAREDDLQADEAAEEIPPEDPDPLPEPQILAAAGDSSPSAEIFIQVGRTLRSQREILGLSLNDIEQYTHIRKFYLQAIEAGKMSELPSPVQAKGMIQSYAQFLDINSDELLLEYAEGLQTQREEKLGAALASQNPRRQYKPEKQTLLRRFLTPDLLIGSSVILILVVFAFWSTSRVVARRNAEAQATIPGISEALASTASQTVAAGLESNNANALAASGSETPAARSTPSPDNPTDPVFSEAVSPTIPDPDDDSPLQVYIVARQRSYLKVLVDGDSEFDGRVVSGNAYPFSGDESIEVVTGNAAALQIFFNQVDLGTIGSFGQVVNLIFKEQGVMTPTAQFTFTPTPTTQATITLQPTATPETPTVTPFIP